MEMSHPGHGYPVTKDIEAMIETVPQEIVDPLIEWANKNLDCELSIVVRSQSRVEKKYLPRHLLPTLVVMPGPMEFEIEVITPSLEIDSRVTHDKKLLPVSANHVRPYPRY